MAVQLISAAQALQNLDNFSVVIDARSEDEHALDCLPHAINWPTLNNQERILVGTLYKQQGAFEAKKIGASLHGNHCCIVGVVENAVALWL